MNRVRTAILRIWGWLDSLIQRLHTPVGHKICFRDRLAWFLERLNSRVFSWAYQGSDEELEAVEHSEVPVLYMNARQRDLMLTLRPGYQANCHRCDEWFPIDWASACPICKGSDCVYVEPVDYPSMEVPSE